MSVVHIDPMLQVETTCGSLLYELQVLTGTSLRIEDFNLSFIYFLSFFLLIYTLVTYFLILSIYSGLCVEKQIIWDEVGESDIERDKMLLELERECLEVYRRKVDTANKCRAQLRQAIADAEAELAAICSAMGERPVHIRQVKKKDPKLCI